jgi:hypothetical protein
MERSDSHIFHISRFRPTTVDEREDNEVAQQNTSSPQPTFILGSVQQEESEYSVTSWGGGS